MFCSLLASGAFSLAPCTLGLACLPFWNQRYGWIDWSDLGFFFCSFSHFFSCDLAQLTGGEKKKNATDFEQAPM
jgi:hypothetical protein